MIANSKPNSKPIFEFELLNHTPRHTLVMES